MYKLLILLFAFTAFAAVIEAKRVVCYFGSWAVYRNGNGKFDVEDIDPTLCTHLIFTFVGLNTDGTIKILDPYNEIDKGAFRRFNALKSRNPNAKTLIAIGGWNEGSEKYSQVAANPQLRSAFARNAAEFVKTHGFDGFDLDWEYPGQRGGSPADKANFAILLKEFRSVFNQYGYLLTAAVGATASHIASSYDVPVLSANLDFINVMAYDLHGAFDGETGENAPLYASSKDVTEEAKERNVDACIQAWISNGAQPEKLNLGIGVYGRSFTLHDPSNTGLGSPASAGTPGPYTQEAGMLGYNEICEQQRSGQWNVVWNEEQKVPHAFLGTQWVGYDDVKSVALKMQYAKQKNLGGAMIWSIETDDFHGICGSKYPILNAINNNL